MGPPWVSVLFLVAAAVIVASVRVLKGDERLVILRLGRVARVAGPGRVLLLPVSEKAIRVNLAGRLPGWRTMSSGELEKRIVEITLADPRGH